LITRDYITNDIINQRVFKEDGQQESRNDYKSPAQAKDQALYNVSSNNRDLEMKK